MAATLEHHLFGRGPKRVLALDGGGVKGIITIAFLEKIEEILRVQSGRGEQFRLCDYFDLVGGTSVGSLLATMIALGHSVADIKALFRASAFDIFTPAFGVRLFSPRFSSRGLRKHARKVLGERTLESADLKTGLAIITKRVDTGSPWVLTNNPKGKFWNDPPDHAYMGNRHYQLSDLVCASTAAPYYFAPKRIRIVRERRDVAQKTGLFIDGGVSPFNNPSLMLLMLAGIKGYGFRWDLGAGNLLLVSVGTGSYRMALNPGFWARNFSAGLAVESLRGLVADADTLSLTLLQWLSAPKRRWEINSEIGTLEGELLGLVDAAGGARPMLSFVRYDVRLEKQWLRENCAAELGQNISDDAVAALQQLDRPDMMGAMYRVGEVAAKKQVTPDDFPGEFGSTADARAMAHK